MVVELALSNPQDLDTVFQLCLFAKVARCRVDYTAFLEGLVCSKSGVQWQTPVSACLLGQQAERAKAVFLPATPCQVTVRVHFSIFPPFSTKVMFGSLIKHSFLHPSTIAEPECAD